MRFLDKSTPLCKSSAEALAEYVSKFSKKDSDFHHDTAMIQEKLDRSVEVLEELFANSECDHFQIDHPDENSSSAGGVVVRSYGSYIASFDINDPDDMELLRRFLKTIDDFYVAAISDPSDPTKVFVSLDWRVDE